MVVASDPGELILLRVASIETPHFLHVNSTNRAVFSENSIESGEIVFDHGNLIVSAAERFGYIHEGAHVFQHILLLNHLCGERPVVRSVDLRD